MSFQNESPDFLEISSTLYTKITQDWWEVTHLGFVVKVQYWFQVALHFVGLRKEPVNELMFSAKDWDLDISDME